jgi:hypothetical protein
MAGRSQGGIPWAGLAAGPAAWAASTQLNYVLASWSCSNLSRLVPLIAAGLAVVAITGAAVSAASWRPRPVPPNGSVECDGAPRRFLAGMSVALGVLFAVVILMQGVAGVILTGCER